MHTIWVILFVILFLLGLLSFAFLVAIVLSAALVDECHIRIEYDGEVFFEYHKDNNYEDEDDEEE